MSFKDIDIDEINHKVYLKGEEKRLAKKEYDLLVYFVKNKNRTLTRDKLLVLWELDDVFVNDNTLSVAINRLRTKLNLKELRTVKNVGYMLDEKI